MKKFILGFVLGGLLVAGLLEGRELWNRMTISEAEIMVNLSKGAVSELQDARFIELQSYHELERSRYTDEGDKAYEATVSYERQNAVKTVVIRIFHSKRLDYWEVPQAVEMEILDSKAYVSVQKSKPEKTEQSVPANPLQH